jgi:hypothetical protein
MATIERTFDPDAVRRLKAEADHDLSVDGPDLAAQAIAAGLGDECHPFLTPSVVGVFPNPEALLRLAGAVLVEAHDEWQVSDRRYPSEGSMAMLNRPAPPRPAPPRPASTEEVAQPALIASESPHR